METKKNPKAKVDPKTKKYVKILYVSKLTKTNNKKVIIMILNQEKESGFQKWISILI